MGKRVLVVDDHADTATMLAVQLEAIGCECQAFMDGRTAVASATAFAPDVALVDLDLPDIDGFAVAEALRAGAGTRPLCLIALTGRYEYRQRALALGFDHFVLKPIGLAKLRSLLAA
jgi:CheY-like chemotaxis protein